MDFLKDCGIVHLGAATALLDGELHHTYAAVAKAAKAEGRMLSFDPNFRSGLWGGNEVEFIRCCGPFLEMADVIKMSEEELVLITGQTELTKGCHYLHEKGAGDAFAWANKVGALTCTRCGAIDAIPRPAELVL